VKKMSAIDQAVKSKEAHRAECARELQTVLASIKNQLDPLAEDAERGRKEIRAYSPTAQATIDKVNRTPYAADANVMPLMAALQGALNNAGTLEQFLKEYAALTTNDLCLRSSGEFDINSPAWLLSYYRNGFNLGRGGSDAMKKAVAGLETRIGYLEEAGAAELRTVAIIPPASPQEPPLTTNMKHDPRQPVGR
jgi:hypothetical protein